MPDQTTPIASGLCAFHLVRVQNPRAPAGSDGDGGFYDDFVDTPPAWSVAWDEGRGGSDEQIKNSVVLTQRAIRVTGAYRADISTRSRLIAEDGRILYVLGVASPEGRKRDLVVQCSTEPTDPTVSGAGR